MQEDAVHVASWGQCNSGRNLGSFLQSQWLERHVMQTPYAPTMPPKDEHMSLCEEAGFCIEHCPDGRQRSP